MLTENSEIVIPYRLRGAGTTLLAILLSIFAGLMLFMATIEPAHFIGAYIGKPFGSLLYSGIGLVVLLMLGKLIKAFIEQRQGSQTIVITPDTISAPKNILSGQKITVRFDAIDRVDLEKSDRAAMKFIQVRTGKKRLIISDLGFETDTDFTNLLRLLKERTKTGC